MKKRLIGVVVLAGLGILLAVQADDWVQQAIDQLRQEVAGLGLRVGRLEHAAGASGGAGPASAGQTVTVPAGTPSMIVDGITQAPNTDDNSQEINQLQQQISSLESTLSQQRDQLSDASGQGIETGTAGQDKYTNRGTVDREIASQRQTVERYATQLGIKKQQLDQLQAANSQPRQIIHGHNPNTVFTLQSKFDLSSTLQQVNPGDLVTWTGTRQSAGQGSETWLIDTITVLGAGS